MGSGGGYLGAGSNITFFGNVVDLSQAGGVGVQFTASTGDIVYITTRSTARQTRARQSARRSTSTGTLVKNNIFYTGAYASVDASSETGSAYDYNIYFSAAGPPFSWGGTAYSLAGWQTSSAADAHSFSEAPDPTFTSAVSITFGGRQLRAARNFRRPSAPAQILARRIRWTCRRRRHGQAASRCSIKIPPPAAGKSVPTSTS